MEFWFNKAFQIARGPYGWIGVIALVVALMLIVRGPSNPRP